MKTLVLKLKTIVQNLDLNHENTCPKKLKKTLTLNT